MKKKQTDVEVGFIGGGRPFTKEDEVAFSAYIQAHKAKHSKSVPRSKKRKAA